LGLFRRFSTQRAGGTRSAPSTLWRRAVLATLDDDLERSESLLAAIAERDSGEFDAYLAIAKIHRKRGDIGRAISIHQTLVLRPDLHARHRMQAIAELGTDYRLGGFERRAIASYEEVLDHDRHHRDSLAALAELYAGDGRFAGALTMLRRRMRVEGRRDDAEEAALWLRWARAERADGRTDAARKRVRRALRRDPRNAAAQLLLGDLEAERGRYARALGPWNAALELDRSQATEIYSRLAAAHAELKSGADFEAALGKRIEDDPDDIPARVAIAKQLDASGKPDEAVSAIRRALDRSPRDLAAHVTLGRLLLARGQTMDSHKGYGELIEALESRSPESVRGALGRVVDGPEKNREKTS